MKHFNKKKLKTFKKRMLKHINKWYKNNIEYHYIMLKHLEKINYY